MKMRTALRRILGNEDINFLLTNRVPRILLTRFVGWISKIRSPVVSRLSIAVWETFTDLDLSDSAATRFASLHDCFTRSLKPGARPIDETVQVMTSPSDGIVGACGQVHLGVMLQAKGMGYRLVDLIGSAADAAAYTGGSYVTLRLTSAMYHRFHAPHDMTLERVNYISGDTWNVNPIALKRSERLFCRNERAVIHGRLDAGGHRIALVPVAAILVASIRLHCANVLLHLRYQGSNHIVCRSQVTKGQELGWFEHGSTIIVLAPAGFALCDGVTAGAVLRMGQPLMHLP